MDYWQIVRRIALDVLRRRKRLAVLCVVVTAAAALPAAYYLSKEPPRYRTSATILLEGRPDRVLLFDEYAPQRPLSVQLAILRSRALAEAVIETLPKSSLQELIDNQYHVNATLRLKNVYRQFMGAELEVESPQRRALNELQQARVNFRAASNDGIVIIEAEASKPQVATDLVNTYVEVMLSRTRSFNVDDARVSREFLEQQLADVKNSLKGSEESQRAFTLENGGIKVPDRSQVVVGQLALAEQTLAEVETNRKMIDTRLAAAKEKMEAQRRAAPPAAAGPAAPPVPAAPTAPAPEVRRLREQLAQLETALLDLRMRYTDEHPRIRLVQERIIEVQRLLASAVKETTPVVASRLAVPPAERVNFAEAVIALETSAHALAAQEEALRRQVDTLRQGLTGLSRKELEYSRMSREVDSNRNLFALISDRLTAARIREQGEMKVVKVIDPPGMATATTSEKRLKLLALALVLAMGVGTVVPVGMELLNRKIENESDVTDVTGLPVLATVPRVRAGLPLFAVQTERSRVGELNEAFMFTEAFRTLRVAVQLAARAENIRSVLITSGFPSEGKSTVVLNLGFAFSEAGTPVVVADTDFLRPSLYKNLDVQSPAGFGDLLAARRPVEDSLVPATDTMWVAASTEAMSPSARGSLATGRLKEVLNDLSTRGELVLCDSAPVLVVPESLFLASGVDAVILVAKAGTTRRRDLAEAKATLDGVGAKILGVVINEMPPNSLRKHYEHYYAKYYRGKLTRGRA